MTYELQFLEALTITIIIETVVLLILCKVFFETPRVNNYSILLTGILASFATLPYLWFVLPAFIKTTLWYHVIGELSVTLAESFIIMGMLRMNYRKSLIISVTCNAVSYLSGLLLNNVL